MSWHLVLLKRHRRTKLARSTKDPQRDMDSQWFSLIFQGLDTHWILCNFRNVYKCGFGAQWQVDNKIYVMSRFMALALEGWSLRPTFLRHFMNQPKNGRKSMNSSSIWIFVSLLMGKDLFLMQGKPESALFCDVFVGRFGVPLARRMRLQSNRSWV